MGPGLKLAGQGHQGLGASTMAHRLLPGATGRMARLLRGHGFDCPGDAARERNIVQAGHQNLPQPPVAADKPSAPKVDPLQQADPWQAYYNRVKGTTPGATGPPAVAAPGPRAVADEGPISAKFLAHDQRMQSLEDAVKALQAGQKEQAAQRQADKEEVAKNFAGLSQQVSTSIEALQRSQAMQQEQLVMGMNELKALVMTSRGSSEGPKKRPAKQPGDAMDWKPDEPL